ncbi:hypothetical protein Hanom_Chr16g01486041 [Helianthus anomalus]
MRTWSSLSTEGKINLFPTSNVWNLVKDAPARRSISRCMDAASDKDVLNFLRFFAAFLISRSDNNENKALYTWRPGLTFKQTSLTSAAILSLPCRSLANV